jgi:hypothetical protein
MQPQVIIDPEFARLIPPHTTSEVAMLTQSCVADGIRDPLKTWQGALLDGHTRYRIAQENDLDYETLELDLPDRDAARTWVLNNQLARRNLHPNGASYLRGKRYLAEVRPEGRPEKLGNCCPVTDRTSEVIAAELGVGEKTIRNDAAFALAVDYLCGDATAVEMGAILSGDTEWTRKDIMDQHKSALREAEAAAKAAGASEKEAKKAAKAAVDDSPAPETISQEVLDAATEAADEVVEETAAIAKEAKEQNVKPREVTKAKAREKREAAVAAQVAEDPNPPLITLADWREWLPQQPDCDLLLTDPPYMTDVDNIGEYAARWLPVALAKVKPTGRAYVCIGAYPLELSSYLAAARLAAKTMHLANVLVWTYRNTMGPSPTLDYKQNWQAILYFRGPDAPPLNCPMLTEQFSVQDINAPGGQCGDRYHAWQKPDELAERFIRHATKPGDLVLDPFAGTGTFILAASRLGRAGRGCDSDPAMIETAVLRGCARGTD